MLDDLQPPLARCADRHAIHRFLISIRTRSVAAAFLYLFLSGTQAGAGPSPAEPEPKSLATAAPPTAPGDTPPTPAEAEGAPPPARTAEATEQDPAPVVLDAESMVEKKRKKRKKHGGKWRRGKQTISGFIQVFYRYALETGDDGLVDFDNFRVQRVRVKLRGKLYPWLGYKISIDPRAPEITGVLRDAFFSLRKVIPRHEIRVGQQKTQFGYENRVSSSRLFAVNRTEVADNLSRGTNQRDIGIGLIGTVPISHRWRFEDAVTLTNGAGFNVQDDNTDMKDVWGRLGFRYKKGDMWVGVGASGGIGSTIDTGDLDLDPVDDFLLRYKRVGVDLEVDTKWFFLNTEVVFGVDDAEGEVESVGGWYVNVVGKTPWPIGPIFRVDTEGDYYRRWLFGVYYGGKDDLLRFFVNYEYREIFDEVRGDDKLYLWSQVRF